MTSEKLDVWAGDESLATLVLEKSERNRRVYETDPDRIDEDAGKEEDLRHGGYGKRQIFELIQNGADQMVRCSGGRVEVVLTKNYLYCANEGAPVDQAGITSLLHTNISPKRSDEIGRFGLGFKSVLGVTARPQFFSRSVSFGFDADWSRKEIAGISPGHRDYPVLRLAKLLNPKREALKDRLLKRLMDWATTVVRLPRDSGAADWLSSDVASFPVEFLLFSRHVGVLVLRDEQNGLDRRIQVERDGTDLLVCERGVEQLWRVTSSAVNPSPRAKEEAGKLAARDSLPLSWAVPLEGTLEVGEFWAFFPLRDRTTLSGIVNAPWQVNDDRTGLLENNELNREILKAAAKLVLQRLADLVDDADPGRVLDLIPARGREARCWGDQLLGEMIYEGATGYNILPDQLGALRRPTDLILAPENIPGNAAKLWFRHPCSPVDWAHHSVDSTNTRRSRAERLFKAASRETATLREWLEILIPPDAPVNGEKFSQDELHAYTQAVMVAAAFVRESDDPDAARASLQGISIVPGAGPAATYGIGKAFLPNADRVDSGFFPLVHPDLVADGEVHRALVALGHNVVKPELELEEFTKRGGFSEWEHDQWLLFWEVARCAPDSEAAAHLVRAARADFDLRVMTLGGAFEPMSRVLAPGHVVGAGHTEDESLALDEDFHRAELGVLVSSGLRAGPQVECPSSWDPLISVYRDRCRETYLKEVSSGRIPQKEKLEFVQKRGFGPLEPLRHLSNEGRVSFTLALAKSSTDWPNWTMRHVTQDAYPKRPFPNPALWAIETWGLLPTSLDGPSPIQECVASSLSEWSAILPVARLDDELAIALQLPRGAEEFGDSHWERAFDELGDITDDALLGKFYTWAAQQGVPSPETIRCRTGDGHGEAPVGEVFVTSGTSDFRHFKRSQAPSILAPDRDAAAFLASSWGMKHAADELRQRLVFSQSDDERPLVDDYPTLRAELRQLDLEDLSLVPCRGLRLERSTSRGSDVESPGAYLQREAKRFLWSEEVSPKELLDVLDKELDLELTEPDKKALLKNQWKNQRQKKLGKIRKLGSEPEKLLETLGEDVLRASLPRGLVEAVSELFQKPEPIEIAELVLVVNGYETLKNLRDELRGANLEVPDQWGGSNAARSFVAHMGFPDEYAGFRSSKPKPTLLVPGPSELPELHDFQKPLVSEVRELIEGNEKHKRGLLSLPTGAGKTRVCVQALTESMEAGRLKSPMLWLAQTDELCEQAVQAWAEVWRTYGSTGDLTVSRLWASNDCEPALRGAPQVVVATPDNLANRIGTAEYEWLAQAACVIVDEAHVSTTPTYTKVLEWQGIQRRGRNIKTRCPLIGLTATPFRGASESETKRLSRRYLSRRLDTGLGEDPYGRLQAEGILSSVEGEVLEGTAVQLTNEQQTQFKKTRMIPPGIFEELGSDTARNARILKSIRRKPKNWSILLFAASVQHAHTLAALLEKDGRKSRAIDGSTYMGLRRRYVEEFRNGELLVLTNFNVLAEGFDAPAVRAIYVARPTFSPNRYQQMIGRGLRGPKNGGSEKCLIVNVKDNWQRFGDQLAFLEFEHLWAP